jgi:RHS repeat-associated protein
LQYSARGLIGHTNQLGKVTKYTWDPAGRKIGETNANSEVLVFKYDPSGNLTNLVDAKTHDTFWKYDLYGRMTNKIDHLGADMFRYAYDAHDHLTNRWTPAKGATAYAYDGAGNLTLVDYPASSDITLAYDKNNRLTNMVDALGTTHYSYTGFGAVSAEDGPWDSDTVSYTYDNARRRNSLTLQAPNGTAWSQSYTHDAMGRLSTVAGASGAFGYGYVKAGSLLTNLSLPNGAAITNSFDSVGRMIATMLTGASGVLSSNSYIYDLAGRRMTNARSSNVWTRYTYDDIGQLKTAWAYQTNNTQRRHEKVGYRYDAAGNLEYRTNDALIQTFAVNGLNQLTNVTRAGNVTAEGCHSGPATNVTVALNGGAAADATLWPDNTFSKAALSLADGANTLVAIGSDALGRYDTNISTAWSPVSNSLLYDSNGNMVTNGARVLEYDDENQLLRITEPNAWKTEFVYDGKMRLRVSRDFTWQNGVWVQTNEVRRVYDGNLVLQERDLFNLPQITYTRGSDLSGSLEGAGGIGGLLARTDHHSLITDSGLITDHCYYHSDANGNIIALIDTNQTVVARYAYEPFGGILAMSGPMAEANTWRFSSKETVGGLVYYLYRFYDPSLQRWINRDPLGDPGFAVLRGDDVELAGDGPNCYIFVNNDPVDLHDDAGLFIGHLYRGYKAWRCRSKMGKWEKECLKDIPPCTRGVGAGAGGPCPYDQPGQNPNNHWWICEAKRVEKIRECAEKAKEVFDKCIGTVSSPPSPPRL